MITKSKVVVLAVLVAIAGLLAVFVADERIERRRMADDRITMRYGALMVGVAAGYTPYAVTLMDFNMAMVSEIAVRLGLRPAFFTTAWDRLFAELDTSIYDIIISSITITAERQSAYNFSKPYMASPHEPELFVIGLKKGNDRLTEAVNRALEDMFNDGTMLRISIETFGRDFVTRAQQEW